MARDGKPAAVIPQVASGIVLAAYLAVVIGKLAIFVPGRRFELLKDKLTPSPKAGDRYNK